RILRRPVDADAVRGAVAERLAERVTLVVEIDDHVADAVPAQEREVVGDEGSAGELDERLRAIERERPQARTEPGGEHHRLHRDSGQGRAANSSASVSTPSSSASARRAVA